MFKSVLFFLVFLCCSQFVMAQHTELSENKGEVGLLMGRSIYQGDIAPDAPFFNWTYGAFVKKQLNNYIGIRFNLEMQEFAAYDILSQDPYSLLRDASFASNTIEGSLMTEFNFLNFVTGSRNRKFTPYLSVGVGYLYVLETLLNVKTSAVLTTTNPNKLPLNLTFPINIGFKYNVYRKFNILGEATYRYTSMDDLDFLSSGINTSSGYQGSASGNDRFFSAKLGISYTFNRIYGMEKNEPKKSKGLLNRFKRK
jgi:hypothetical protein